jgi:hypothetical protein
MADTAEREESKSRINDVQKKQLIDLSPSWRSPRTRSDLALGVDRHPNSGLLGGRVNLRIKSARSGGGHDAKSETMNVGTISRPRTFMAAKCKPGPRGRVYVWAQTNIMAAPAFRCHLATVFRKLLRRYNSYLKASELGLTCFGVNATPNRR